MTVSPPRDGATRKQHVLHLLETEIDAWVATADEHGEVCQIPLSFLWHEGRLVFATPEGSVTASAAIFCPASTGGMTRRLMASPPALRIGGSAMLCELRDACTPPPPQRANSSATISW